MSVYLVITILGKTLVLGLIGRLFRPLMEFLGLSGEVVMGVVLGNVLNLYAAIGAVTPLQFDRKLTQREMVLIITFLSLNHSFFEDVLLFVAIGAQGTVLQVIRMVVAVVLTVVLARVLKPGCEVQERV
ncbi:MAG: nucleoside recognition protein [Deltaproteobacteria bacterium]|nr:nucleoside recognition protein [Candidatus Tharpella sp.]